MARGRRARRGRGSSPPARPEMGPGPGRGVSFRPLHCSQDGAWAPRTSAMALLAEQAGAWSDTRRPRASLAKEDQRQLVRLDVELSSSAAMLETWEIIQLAWIDSSSQDTQSSALNRRGQFHDCHALE